MVSKEEKLGEVVHTGNPVDDFDLEMPLPRHAPPGQRFEDPDMDTGPSVHPQARNQFNRQIMSSLYGDSPHNTDCH